MTRVRLRLVRAATATLLAIAAGAVVAPSPAEAGSAGYCPDASGVTVVVDFHELGGGVVIRCAPGGQGSGLTALQNAGFTVAGTTRWGLAFICRIEGKPTAASEPCVDTPPATAYWSYWHAPNGGTWTYSDLGVKNRTPPPGSFDGWSFSKNHTEGTAPKPGVTPSRPAPPAPPPATTAQPQPQPESARGPGAPTPTLAPGSTGPATSAAASETVPAPSGSPDQLIPQPNVSDLLGSVGATAATGTPPADVDAVRTTFGVPLGTLAGLGLLLALAAAGGFAVWWRRRTSRDT
ncbi:hypothetical protein ACQP00_20550 [Dactylosporangium sp. CS-047395]|uniref:hypothetical protein n=1 Tax=Dactylosporangium sp. CS-047395 TaxID=3239936 RepID=UPI003D92FD27